MVCANRLSGSDEIGPRCRTRSRAWRVGSGLRLAVRSPERFVAVAGVESARLMGRAGPSSAEEIRLRLRSGHAWLSRRCRFRAPSPGKRKSRSAWICSHPLRALACAYIHKHTVSFGRCAAHSSGSSSRTTPRFAPVPTTDHPCETRPRLRLRRSGRWLRRRTKSSYHHMRDTNRRLRLSAGGVLPVPNDLPRGCRPAIFRSVLEARLELSPLAPESLTPLIPSKARRAKH